MQGGWMDSLKFFKVVCISTLSLAFLLRASIPAFAQAGSTGRIIGSITDSTGAVIGGATISVTDTGSTVERWSLYDNPSAFSGLGYNAVPFFSGTSNADCVAKAAALDAGYPPLYPGYTYSSSLSKY